MLRPDLILEGVQPDEIDALALVANDADYWPAASMRMALVSKGWVDQFGDVLVLTLVGRTLLEGANP